MPNAQLGDKGTIYQCRTCCQNSDENFDYAAALGRLNVASRQAQEEKSVYELAVTVPEWLRSAAHAHTIQYSFL